MARLMSPLDAVFLLAESREQPMHVGALQLFQPPDGADAHELRALFDAAVASDEVAPLFRKRPHRSLASLGQWSWQADGQFDLQQHVSHSALPQPGRALELLALCSRLHSALLDRHRPLWETHLIEGLDDGRYAAYFKVHHALVDGVSALRLLSRVLTENPDLRGMPGPWAPEVAPEQPDTEPIAAVDQLAASLRSALELAGDAAGIVPALARGIHRGRSEQSGSISFAAPQTMLNVAITGARRFAAQSWPIGRVRRIGAAAGATVNDVVLALCSGALRTYLASFDALPDVPLIAMVPVSLHEPAPLSLTGASLSALVGGADGGGNAVGAVMCNLGTQLADPAERLATVHRSMAEGKQALRGMSRLQILALTAAGMSPLLLGRLFARTGTVRPPFNLVISNVAGPDRPRYWNGARLDELYPLSILVAGQALNITVTSYAGAIAFGLTGCPRSVPHLQRLLGYLEAEFAALESAADL